MSGLSKEKSELRLIPERNTSSPPIVGIGASAGGLEAFEIFFHSVPIDTGIIYILVPHLDPDHESMLVDILGRVTKLSVLEAHDQMEVLPNHVYVIPPNREMTFCKRRINLSIPDTIHGQPMKIDLFFRSLAEELGDRAIGIIFSGTGTDGTLGLRAIQGVGGLTFVQDPKTAKYNGMPSSAINAGYATYVLPVEQIPARLIDTLKNFYDKKTGFSLSSGEPPVLDKTEALSRILRIIKSKTGHDFSQYKKSTILRRISRRMSVHAIEELDGYAEFLQENSEEVRILFRELLINVTSFFRDAEAFEFLKNKVLPDLIRVKENFEVFRVWVPGCATGEEAYSLAIIIREVLDELEKDCKVQIYSTDIAEDVIAIARRGFYPPNIVTDITPERLNKFFVREETGFQVKKEIREMVIYATQNIIRDPPFIKLDLLSSRNLLIYLEPELQSRVIPAFHYSLNPGGILFLSRSESVGTHQDLFKPLSRKWKIYQATGIRSPVMATMETAHTNDILYPPTFYSDIPSGHKEPKVVELTKNALLKAYIPPSVVTDEDGNIIYVYGDTGKFLRPAQGQATLSVVEMAREGLQLELRSAITIAKTKKTMVVKKDLQVRTNGGFETVHLEVRSVTSSETTQNILIISFIVSDTDDLGEESFRKQHSGKKQIQPEPIKKLEEELQYTKENLNATIEEMQAANEELQSTNEELQSTNEELETSKEEIQSVNEEMMTVNAELQAKISQLAEMQNDMKNLLSSTGIGTIFLDTDFVIRWFTPEATTLYKLVVSDVGRKLCDIKSMIVQDDLIEEAQIVLDSLVPKEKEIKTMDNAWFLVRILPYRTLENVIDGIVLSFTDINSRKIAEEEVTQSREYAENIVNTIRDPLLVLDKNLTVVSASHSYYRIFHTSAPEIEGKKLTEINNNQWNIPHLISLLQTILPEKTSFEDIEVKHIFPDIGERILILNARVLTGKNGVPDLILLAIEDISELIRTKDAFEEANKKLKFLTGLTRHDIINHISAVGLTLDLIQEENDLEEIHKWTASAAGVCKNMEATIGFTREYESFGTISSGWKFIYPIIESAKTEIHSEKVVIENQISPDLEIYGEPILRKVFVTLMENAIRHGENISRVIFSVHESEDSCIITCEDNGAGIPANKKERIFNHGYGKHTGIGLFLAREILSITGMSIRECGIEGKGAKFEILIPAGKFRITKKE